MKTSILLIALLISGAGKAYSCDCDDAPETTNEIVKRSTFVFTGTVISFKKTYKIMPDHERMGFTEYEIAVISMLKGDTLKTAIVLSENSSCGMIFKTGKTYLFFAGYFDESLDKLRVHRCISYCPDVESEGGKEMLREVEKISGK